MSRLVHAFSDPGELVVDPMLGSGTTAVAAHLASRRFIGGDLNPAAIRFAAARLPRRAPLARLAATRAIRRLKLRLTNGKGRLQSKPRRGRPPVRLGDVIGLTVPGRSRPGC